MQQADIDLVVTWVDGNDPKWQQERSKYAPAKEKSMDFHFRDWRLLRYWFRGVEQNLPWIRKVHFVTYGHLPPWLNTNHPKLNIVRHDDFIPASYLPTFNSIVISQNMHRIDALAEQFIYTNDDIYFIDYLPKEYYFRDGLPCDVLSLWPFTENGDLLSGHILWNDIICINRHFDMTACMKAHGDKWFHSCYSEQVRERNMTYAQLLKYFPGFDYDHYPNAYLKSTFEKVWEKERFRLNELCFHRFRDFLDMNEWVMRYWQLAEGNFIPRMPSGCAFCNATGNPELLRDVILSGKNRIVCINDYPVDVDVNTRSAYLQRLFETILPDMSSYERF